MELLDRDFVNAWVVAKHLPRMAAEASDPAVRSLALAAHEKYIYPVDSQVYSPAGELLRQVGTNDIFDDPVGKYLELLKAEGK